MEQTPDLNQIMKLAQSPAGQQLLNMLRKQDSQILQKAAQMAASGNYTQAKSLLTGMLANAEAEQLIRQLEDSK